MIQFILITFINSRLKRDIQLLIWFDFNIQIFSYFFIKRSEDIFYFFDNNEKNYE